MEYKKSSIFSDKQKIDNRNLCLYLNFKNEKNENILNLLKLIEKDLIEKFEDDFIFDMEFNEEPITNKYLHNKFNNIGDNLNKKINLLYDAILKSESISTKFEYKDLISKRIFMEDWDMSEIEFEFDLNDIDSIKDYIINNMKNTEVDYLSEPTPQDIGLNFNCEYIERDENTENDDFGFYGSLSFNISGYILDYDFDYFIDYLKDFVKKCGQILKSLCANIFISEKNFKTEYFNLFEMELIENKDIEDKDIYDEYINHHRYGLLCGIEGINYISKDLFSQIDKDKLKNYPIKVEIHENGVFVNIDKSLEDIDIDDKYEVREVLDNILIKGYCDHDVIQFMEFLGKVPIYEEEILIVEILENETRKDLYNKYFIITKNKEVEYLSLDSDKFKIHKLK